ncbi:MAG: YfjP family GTPase [Nocardioidaceae bacterium]
MSEGRLDTGRRGVGEREVDGPDVDEQGVDEQGVDAQDASPPGAKTETTLRLDGLGAAVEAARGRLDDALLREAADVVSRGRRRLGLSSEHTIVALAGATGSGKSSLFNALCDLDLAAVGVKRPTTSWALACAWGSDGATEILDWLGIPTRHQVNRTGLLDETAADRDLHGLVLLDLPDHDSTEVSHRLEVERLVELADVMVWVLDPQKYADAVIHDRYLRPLSSHAEVMLVALNHVDEIPPGGVESCLLDVRRLLELDGLENVPVLATSATEGRGIAELRQILVRKVSDKRSARERVDADVAGMARRLEQQAGSAQGVELGADLHKQLLDACVDSAGVPVIVGALESTALISARRATAWPVAAWLGGMRSDPMSRLPDPDTPATRRADPPSGFEDEATPSATPTGGAHRGA